MKNHILPIILLMMLTYTSEGQSFWDDVTISAQFAAAHHDKRVFHAEERLLKEQPEKWGTWQYGIVINKRIVSVGNILEANIGLGYSFEHLTFKRLIDHCFYKPGKSCTKILVYSDDYWVQQVLLPINIAVEPIRNWQINLDIRPSFATHKSFSGRNIRKWMFDFYSLEISPGLRYEYEHFIFGVNYRLWQWKKIDRVLFTQRTIRAADWSDPILTNTYEHYNPVKLWFSLGYQLGE